MTEQSLLNQIQQLPVAEQVELLRDMWDSLVDSGQPLGLSERQRHDLDRRLEQYRKTPEHVISWPEARKEIEGS